MDAADSSNPMRRGMPDSHLLPGGSDLAQSGTAEFVPSVDVTTPDALEEPQIAAEFVPSVGVIIPDALEVPQIAAEFVPSVDVITPDALEEPQIAAEFVPSIDIITPDALEQPQIAADFVPSVDNIASDLLEEPQIAATAQYSERFNDLINELKKLLPGEASDNIVTFLNEGVAWARDPQTKQEDKEAVRDLIAGFLENERFIRQKDRRRRRRRRQSEIEFEASSNMNGLTDSIREMAPS